MPCSPIPADVLIEARERARIVHWLMLYRHDLASRPNLPVELAANAEAIIQVIIEHVAAGAHAHLEIDFVDDRQALH